MKIQTDSVKEIFAPDKDILVIAGPCSAENENQVLTTARQIAETGKASVYRAGIWTPRTRPNNFEGVGEIGLQWMAKAREETGLPFTTEVASAAHVEMALKYDADILWIGARTTVNPFSVQEIADALQGVDIPVMVKNPINPDLALWMGAMERLSQAGIKKLAAVHRGFSTFEKTPFRNVPQWELAIEMKTAAPELDIICDPSHIAGTPEIIPLVSQKAIDLDMAGLMIETHYQPKVALSDAKQQVKPSELDEIISDLKIRTASIRKIKSELEGLRHEIDQLDDAVIERLATRMNVAEKIGEYKRDNDVTILQVNRWDEIVHNRVSMAKSLGLSEDFVDGLLKLIHKESIRRQNEVMNQEVAK